MSRGQTSQCHRGLHTFSLGYPIRFLLLLLITAAIDVKTPKHNSVNLTNCHVLKEMVFAL